MGRPVLPVGSWQSVYIRHPSLCSQHTSCYASPGEPALVVTTHSRDLWRSCLSPFLPGHSIVRRSAVHQSSSHCSWSQDGGAAGGIWGGQHFYLNPVKFKECTCSLSSAQHSPSSTGPCSCLSLELSSLPSGTPLLTAGKV